jgi:hypothetical protein
MYTHLSKHVLECLQLVKSTSYPIMLPNVKHKNIRTAPKYYLGKIIFQINRPHLYGYNLSKHVYYILTLNEQNPVR